MGKKSKKPVDVKLTWGELGNKFGTETTLMDTLPSAPSGAPAESRPRGGNKYESRSEQSAWRRDGPSRSGDVSKPVRGDDIFDGDWRKSKSTPMGNAQGKYVPPSARMNNGDDRWGPSAAPRPFSLGLGKSKQHEITQTSNRFVIEKISEPEIEKEQISKVPKEDTLKTAMEKRSTFTVRELESFVGNVDFTNIDTWGAFIDASTTSFLEKTLSVKEYITHLPEEHRQRLLEDALKSLSKKSITDERLLRIVRESDVDVLEELGIQEDSIETLEKKLGDLGLSAFVPNEKQAIDVPGIVSKCFVEDSVDKVMSNIKAVPKQIQELDAFAHEVAEEVFEQYFESKGDDAVLSKYETLLKYVSTTMSRQEAVVLACHHSWEAKGMPKQLGKKCFAALSESQMILPEAFLAWRDSKTNRGHHKAKLLLQVSALVSDMIPQRVLEQEEEEEEEEELEEEFMGVEYSRDNTPSYR